MLVYRVGLPLWRTWRHQLRVTSVVHEAEGMVSVHVAGRHLSRLPVEAGQFFTWRFLGRAGWTRGNPYSLSAAPDGSSLRITVKQLGDGSSALTHVRPGSRVLVEGPFGRLSPRVRTRDGLAFIGAGVGVTPLRALAEQLSYRPGQAVFVHRYGDEPLFRGELRRLAHDRGLQLVTLPGPRRDAGSWLPVGSPAGDDATVLRHWVPDIADRDIYVCGPDLWSASVRRTLLAAGTPAHQIHVESFAW